LQEGLDDKELVFPAIVPDAVMSEAKSADQNTTAKSSQVSAKQPDDTSFPDKDNTIQITNTSNVQPGKTHNATKKYETAKDDSSAKVFPETTLETSLTRSSASADSTSASLSETSPVGASTSFTSPSTIDPSSTGKSSNNLNSTSAINIKASLEESNQSSKAPSLPDSDPIAARVIGQDKTGESVEGQSLIIGDKVCNKTKLFYKNYNKSVRQ
jgi:hypothetical protein